MKKFEKRAAKCQRGPSDKKVAYLWRTSKLHWGLGDSVTFFTHARFFVPMASNEDDVTHMSTTRTIFQELKEVIER